MKITLLVWYKTGNVFEQWEDDFKVTFSVTSMNVYPCFFCICVVLFRNIRIFHEAHTHAKGPPVTGDS